MDLSMLHKFPANMAINKMKRQNMNKMLKKIYQISKQNLTIQLQLKDYLTNKHRNLKIKFKMHYLQINL